MSPPPPRPAAASTTGVRSRLPLYSAVVRESSDALRPVVDRSTMVVQSLHDEPDDRRWWWTRPVAERLAAIEIMRRTLYGRAATDGRLQRVLEITQRESR